MKKVLDKKKVVVGISGGVDSAMAAEILARWGYDVKCVFIKLCRYRGGVDREITAAKKVAKSLGLPLQIIDKSQEFKKLIVDHYNQEIKNGRTPSPCVFCNPKVKIKALLEIADTESAYFVATGHYARIEKSSDGHYLLRKAKDKSKDQTYSLCFIKGMQLRRMIFPLGNLTKKEVIKLALKSKKLGFAAKSKQSQDFCYLGGVSQLDYLRSLVPCKVGRLLDNNNKCIGCHQGAYLFTIGQRKGIGLPGGPYFVRAKDVKKNEVYITNNKEDLKSKQVKLQPVNLINSLDKNSLSVTAKIRSNQPEFAARLDCQGGSLVLKFSTAQLAVTPGQVAVFYQKDICLGGGVIN